MSSHLVVPALLGAALAAGLVGLLAWLAAARAVRTARVAADCRAEERLSLLLAAERTRQAGERAIVHGMLADQQGLVREQLGLVTELERIETDQTRFATLLELDHLTTRVRRTTQNLLLLTHVGSLTAGTAEPPGRASMTAVLRSAIGEIDRYRSVVLCDTDEVLVDRAIAVPLAHLVSEMLDTVLAAMPAGDGAVRLRGSRIGRASDPDGTGYFIETIVALPDGTVLSTDDLLRSPVAAMITTELGLPVVVPSVARGTAAVPVDPGCSENSDTADGAVAVRVALRLMVPERWLSEPPCLAKALVVRREKDDRHDPRPGGKAPDPKSDSAPGPPLERTKNGLVKRVPQTQGRTSAPTARDAAPTARDAAPTARDAAPTRGPAIGRSSVQQAMASRQQDTGDDAERIRQRLSSFRAGVLRAEAEAGHRDASPVASVAGDRPAPEGEQ